MKRMICRAIGCNMLEDAPACKRCGGALYYEFLETGWMEPAISAYRRLKWKLRAKRCFHCEKRLLPGLAYQEDFCSAECFDEWIPF